jgi:hypothetical protein
MEPKGSVVYSQETATGLYPKPDEFDLDHIVFLSEPF